MSALNLYQPPSEGDNVRGSVCPFVHPFVCVSVCLSVRALLLGVKGGQYRSEVLSVIRGACVDNLAGAVDQLLMRFILTICRSDGQMDRRTDATKQIISLLC